MKSYYAHGKLLISAEYMVMHGARALALPLRLGQSLKPVPSRQSRVFSWNALYNDRSWFNARMDPAGLKILHASDMAGAEYLRKVILACIDLSPSFQESLFRWDVETNLEFSPSWGMGSSSTLTALMAEWAGVCALDLHFMVSEGSGYDVACALAEGPILYWLRDEAPHYQHVPFHPPFSDHLYFAWLGYKQPTTSHLQSLTGRLDPSAGTVLEFSALTERFVEAPELGRFQELMKEHEQLLSKILGMPAVAATRLEGLPGAVKSLGAWGGDFVLIASDTPEEVLFDYLHQRDIHTIYRYRELVHERESIRENIT